jgi:hypothetical protein
MRHRNARRRRATRSEVDQFAPGPRPPDGGRGGFDTAHSDADPGGTSGEHSGQVFPAAGTDSVEAEHDHDDEGEDRR